MTDSAPSFSMILETANLELADIAVLRQCLDSVAAQTVEVETAREIVMVEGGEVPTEQLEKLRADYQWLSMHSIPPGTGYEEAKLMGVNFTSGEILVFFDADCVYEPTWLHGLLMDGLQAHPDIGLLGGETMIRTNTVWGMISALLFSFDFYTDRTRIYEHERFHFNNFAIRRDILLKHPFPSSQPLFRTSSLLYSAELRQAGINLARQPLSRARHAAPNGWTHFFWRYLMFGHDAATVLRLSKERNERSADVNSKAFGTDLVPNLTGLIAHRLKAVAKRVRYLISEDPANWRRLPIVLPMAGLGLGLMLMGYLCFSISPRLLPAVMPSRIKLGTGFAERIST